MWLVRLKNLSQRNAGASWRPHFLIPCVFFLMAYSGFELCGASSERVSDSKPRGCKCHTPRFQCEHGFAPYNDIHCQHKNYYGGRYCGNLKVGPVDGGRGSSAGYGRKLQPPAEVHDEARAAAHKAFGEASAQDAFGKQTRVVALAEAYYGVL